MKEFIEKMPKAELHVHLEGTLEPEHIFSLAQRNNIELDYSTPEEVIAAYDFHDLPSFLTIYYAAMNVLRTEQDFYELAYHYFERAKADNIIYVEPFFDPQAHTSRGVDFETIIGGIKRAQEDAEVKLGIESNLIMCFLRDMSAESAMEHLEMSLPFKDHIIGVGLDSDEKNNPPEKFAEVFARARAEGYKLTMHCDLNQENILEHIRECLDLINVDRIDHGYNCLEDDDLVQEIVSRGLGLTICPISNRMVIQSLTGAEIKKMLDHGIKATINSDDPAYFRAYLNDNFIALAEEGELTKEEIVQLSRNAFDIAWLPDSRRQNYTDLLNEFTSN
ncbi:MAG TPA: adenosine deaminase [Gammaproteobacteria bacterium]|nr:adenosine deaminase [Gammaproteobacteria bacterium]